MNFRKLLFGAAAFLALSTTVEAEPIELSARELDRVTAAGPLANRLRAAFGQLALAELQNGFAGGPRGAASAGAYVLSEYVKLEILIAQNNY